MLCAVSQTVFRPICYSTSQYFDKKDLFLAEFIALENVVSIKACYLLDSAIFACIYQSVLLPRGSSVKFNQSRNAEK